MRLAHFLLAAAMLVGISSRQARAQTPDNREVIQRLQALEELVRSPDKRLADLGPSLRYVTQSPPPPPALPPIKLDITTAAVKGSANARVVLIEYSDFECPFCGRHAQKAFHDIQREFVESGLVRYVFRHLPLEQLHPSAKKAAEAAECAREQGKFWEMHDRLFANQKSLSVDKLIDHASAEQLDLTKFRSCLVEGQMAATVSEHLAEARRLGITGTPSFLIGEIQPDGTVHVIRKLSGAEPFQVFRTALNNLLTKPGSK